MTAQETKSFINIVTDSFSAFKFVEPHVKYIEGITGYKGLIACNFSSFDDAKSFSIEQNPVNIRIDRDISLINDISAFFTLFRLIKSNSFSLVHTHNAKAGVIGRLAAKFARCKSIIHTTYDYGFINLQRNPFIRFFYVMLERIVGKFTDQLIVVSKTTYRDALKYKVIQPEKIIIIPEAPSMEEFNLDKIDPDQKNKIDKKYQINKKSDEFFIGTIARLVPHKGIDTLIKAAAIILKQNMNVRFLIIGGGKEELNLKNLARKLDILDSLIFTGFIEDQSEMIYLYNLMDIFWLATKSEGQGLVYSEANLMNVPVIGSDIEPVRSMIGEGGILCDPNDE